MRDRQREMKTQTHNKKEKGDNCFLHLNRMSYMQCLESRSLDEETFPPMGIVSQQPQGFKLLRATQSAETKLINKYEIQK